MGSCEPSSHGRRPDDAAVADTVEVLIVSPLATVRAGLVALLTAAGGVRIGGEAVTLEDGTAPDSLADVDVVLLDAASADELDEAVTTLAGGRPGLVVLGPPGSGERLAQSQPGYAWAFLGREAGPERIVAAVRAVAAGLVAYEPELAPAALHSRSAGPLPSDDDVDALTAREHEVLTLVAIGLTNKAIARRLSISDHTVKFHVAAILAKLGAESRTEAVHVAARRGVLTL
jgi:DNA-binding NarL/FixJ family response regulator